MRLIKSFSFFHALPTTLPSTTLLCTQLTNTNHICEWWQNGTRCRDGVKVLWCHSHLVWLVFEASIPTCTCFHSENFLWLVPAIFVVVVCFLYCCLGMVREKRGGRGGQGEDAWSIKYDNVHIQLRIIINSNAFKHHTSLSTRVYKPKQSVKPHKTQVKSTCGSSR